MTVYASHLTVLEFFPSYCSSANVITVWLSILPFLQCELWVEGGALVLFKTYTTDSNLWLLGSHLFAVKHVNRVNSCQEKMQRQMSSVWCVRGAWQHHLMFSLYFSHQSNVEYSIARPTMRAGARSVNWSRWHFMSEFFLFVRKVSIYETSFENCQLARLQVFPKLEVLCKV